MRNQNLSDSLDSLALYTYDSMTDEDWLKQDEKEQGKPKVAANNGKLKGHLELN